MRKLVADAARTLNFDSSPGLGQFWNYPTIGQALGWDGFCFRDEINMRKLNLIIKQRLSSLKDHIFGPQPLKMFIKEEPISKEKLMRYRHRIIFAMALEDQVLDRILFGKWHEADVAHFSQVPNKSGWTPVPEGFWLVKRDFPEKVNVLATDCTAFDWTLPGWVVDLIINCKLLQNYEAYEDYEIIARNRVKEVLGSQCLVRFPSGATYKQNFTGLMKSGWLLTISFNGWAQFMINALSWRRMCGIARPLPVMWTMGDDVLMSWDPSLSLSQYESNLRKLGVLVKPGALKREFSGFEFVYEEGKIFCNPLYVHKHKFQLRHYSEEDLFEVVDMYACLYALASPSCREWFEPLQRKYGSRNSYWYECWAWGIPLPGHVSFKTSDFEY